MTVRGRRSLPLPVLAILALATASSLAQERRVSVYVSVDQEHAEDILKAFERKTGIKVAATYDTEATKTVSLVQRIVAEGKAPKADVFWNNECGQTMRLKEKGLLETYVSPGAATIPDRWKDRDGQWTGFAARARVIAWNTKLTREENVPTHVRDLAGPRWKGAGVIAKPLNGTTLTHVCALYAIDGKDATDAWLESLIANDVRFTGGNGPAMREVAEGQPPSKRAFCLTDTDDAYASAVEGFPTKFLYPDQGPDDPGLVLIPNTVMMIKGAPDPAEARVLIDTLLSPEVEAELATGRSAQIPLHPGVPRPDHVRAVESLKLMPIDWTVVGRMIDSRFDRLEKKFETAPTPAAPGGAPAAQDRTATWILLGVAGFAVLLIVVRATAARQGEAA